MWFSDWESVQDFKKNYQVKSMRYLTQFLSLFLRELGILTTTKSQSFVFRDDLPSNSQKLSSASSWACQTSNASLSLSLQNTNITIIVNNLKWSWCYCDMSLQQVTMMDGTNNIRQTDWQVIVLNTTLIGRLNLVFTLLIITVVALFSVSTGTFIVSNAHLTL